jgi:hypothetical protein
MLFVLFSSVLVALLTNRLVFGRRAVWIFSAEGRKIRAEEAVSR